jgi:hypothetical protein
MTSSVRTGSCDFCGERAPLASVHFRQNTGMLVIRHSREWAGEACRDCGKQWFWKSTVHTFFLGWWGTISFVVTPIFIVLNIVSLVRALRLPTAEAMRREALDAQQEYARNLLRTKDRETVVDVLTRSSGAPRADVESFVFVLEQHPNTRSVDASV